jgi:hypothetical protein
MILSRSFSSIAVSTLAACPIGIAQMSLMLCPPIVTASDSGLRRAPPQSGHGTSRM